ncbi:UNVERIFIED_CONTAM: hypothetical protein PYX00_007052 [Menopon gallinae]|uniref:Uncharacterized protein n=1 Tax=Menopon gallinae TaxID=328185 RepID=A0AAW2HI76_9NEOP
MYKICLYITPEAPVREAKAFGNQDAIGEAPWWSKEKGCCRRYRKPAQAQEDEELLMNMRNCKLLKDPEEPLKLYK